MRTFVFLQTCSSFLQSNDVDLEWPAWADFKIAKELSQKQTWVFQNQGADGDSTHKNTSPKKQPTISAYV